MTTIELASHIKEMRDLQNAYFASKRESRWGDKKILAASKLKEAQVDAMAKEVLECSAEWLERVKRFASANNFEQNDRIGVTTIETAGGTILAIIDKTLMGISPLEEREESAVNKIQQGIWQVSKGKNNRVYVRCLDKSRVMHPDDLCGLNGLGIYGFGHLKSLAMAILTYEQVKPPCPGNCWASICDTNGCMERKRVPVDFLHFNDGNVAQEGGGEV